MDNQIIIVNKEKGPTSRDVVNKLCKILNTKKIGHTGTLDPLASGVLVVATGRYTKLVDKLTSLDKEYIATVKLGIMTDTLDVTGTVLKQQKYSITKGDLEKTLDSFVTTYEQTVPAYSAVKINGKKLYEYARNNEEIKLPKRPVTIKSIELLDFYETGFKFKVKVSKGTYIRSLIKDVCNKLDTIGVMEDLIRTAQGNFKIENSYTLEDIASNKYKSLNIKEALNYPIIEIDDETFFKVKNGVQLEKNLIDGKYIFTYLNEDIAIYEFKDNVGKMDFLIQI